MIRKQDLNKNWSDLSSVLFESLPESLQNDQLEWLSYHWNLVVGKEIADISSIDKITKSTLYIRVQGKEWLSALESLKKKIIQEINSRAGKNLVENIKLKV
ncbi:MAG: putative nucleic acid-binding Zn ribbon protein [Nitrospinales bacterium]|jgi:predicted nucleic acid-binding Zn ribbon protein